MRRDSRGSSSLPPTPYNWRGLILSVDARISIGYVKNMEIMCTDKELAPTWADMPVYDREQIVATADLLPAYWPSCDCCTAPAVYEGDDCLPICGDCEDYTTDAYGKVHCACGRERASWK